MGEKGKKRMRRFFSKIATLSVGLAMAIGVGVALGFKETKVVNAATPDVDTAYALVNSVEGLEVGKNYIITNGTSGTVSVMKQSAKNNNKDAVEATVVGDQILFTSDMLNLELGGSSGAWTFLTTNYADGEAASQGYLNATSSTNKNYLNVVATPDNYNKFSISFSSNKAIITCTGKNTRNVLYYNGTNDLFSCYTQSNDYYPVYLFKEVIGGVKLVSVTATGDYKNTYYAGQSFDPTGLTINATYSDESVTHPDLAEVTWSPATLTVETTKVTGTYKGKTFDLDVTVVEDTVSSLAITGSMTQTAYYTGETWNPAGFTVNATYASTKVVDVTAEVEWSYSPEAPVAGAESVVCTASFGGKSIASSAQAVTVTLFTGYAKVSSTEGLTIGDSYVLGVGESEKLMGPIDGGSKYRTAVTATEKFLPSYNGVLTPLPENTAIITLLGDESGKYVLYDMVSEKFLQGSAVGGTNELYNVASIDDASLWTITFSEGEMNIGLYGTTRVLGFNKNSPRFTTYASYSATTLRPTLYKIVGSEIKTALITFCADSLKMDQYVGDNTYDKDRCEANYAAAKTAYAAFNSAKKNVFAYSPDYADAKARLVKWAAANGEEFNAVDGTFTPFTKLAVNNYIGGSSANYAIIIIVATVSITALGLTLMIAKKKKHD